jgi:hypothetical protein
MKMYEIEFHKSVGLYVRFGVRDYRRSCYKMSSFMRECVTL